MKNSILFILLIVVVGLTALEFQKKVIRKPITLPQQTAIAPSTRVPEATIVLHKPIKETPVAKTIEGEYGCLPRKVKQSEKTVTLECVYGLKLSDGSYVALDIGDFNDKQKILVSGNKLRVSGKFVPVEQLSSDYWQKYHVTGIMRTSEITKK